jgi:hypothetical protein
LKFLIKLIPTRKILDQLSPRISKQVLTKKKCRSYRTMNCKPWEISKYGINLAKFTFWNPLICSKQILRAVYKFNTKIFRLQIKREMCVSKNKRKWAIEILEVISSMLKTRRRDKWEKNKWKSNWRYGWKRIYWRKFS